MKTLKLFLIASLFACVSSAHGMDLTCHEKLEPTKKQIAFTALKTISHKEIMAVKATHYPGKRTKNDRAIGILTGLAIGRVTLQGFDGRSAEPEIRKFVTRLVVGPKKQKRTCRKVVKTIKGRG